MLSLSWTDLLLRVRALRSDAVPAAVATGISAVRGIVLLPIVAKQLHPEDYGLWAQLGVAATLLTMLVAAGIDSAALRYLGGERRPDKDRVFAAVWLVALVFALVGASACAAVALLVLEGGARAGTLVLGVLVIGSVAERAALTQTRRLEHFWDFAGAIAVLAFAEVVSITVALFLGYGVAGAILAWGALKFVTAVAVLIHSQICYRALGVPRAAGVGRLLGFGAPLVLVALLLWVLNLSDRFLVGWLLGLRDVALYSASYAVGSIAALPFAPVFVVVQSKASGLWQDDKREAASAVLWVGLEWGVWFAIPVVVLLITLAPELLAFLTRPEYAEAATSAGIVAVATCVQMLSGFAETELGLFRHSRRLVPIFAAAAVVNVVINLALLPVIGYVGAAIATLVGVSVQAGLAHLSVLGAPGWRWRISRILPSIAFAVALTAILLLVRPFGLVLMLALSGAAALLYAVMAVRIMRLEVGGS